MKRLKRWYCRHFGLHYTFGRHCRCQWTAARGWYCDFCNEPMP